MAEITDSIIFILNFAWAPLFILGLIVAVARFINKEPVREASVRLTSWLSNVSQSKSITSLKELQLGYLIPMFIAILILAVLQFVNGPLMRLSNSLPPYISYVPSGALEQRTTAFERCIVQKSIPIAGDFGQAYAIASSKLDHKAIYEMSDTNYLISNQIKLLMIAVSIYWGWNIVKRRQEAGISRRACVALLAISIFWSANLVLLLRAQEQYLYAEWRQIWSDLDSNKFDEWRKECDMSTMNRESTTKKRHWWSIEFYDSRTASWIYKNFIE